MPRLAAPEPRHYGRAERTIERGGRSVTIGLVYDPARVPAAKLDGEFDEAFEDALRQAQFAAQLGTRPKWYPHSHLWEAVAVLEARYPGDVLPHPALPLPDDLRYPRWTEGEEERRRRLKREESRAKGQHILETGDWAVDGEGA